MIKWSRTDAIRVIVKKSSPATAQVELRSQPMVGEGFVCSAEDPRLCSEAQVRKFL